MKDRLSVPSKKIHYKKDDERALCPIQRLQIKTELFQEMEQFSFKDNLCGICLESELLLNANDHELVHWAERLRERHLSCYVDVRSQINHFPGLTLVDAIPTNYQSSVRIFRKLLHKAAILDAKGLIISAHGQIEAHYTNAQAMNSMAETLRVLMQETRTPLYFSNNRYSLLNSPNEVGQFLSHYKLDKIQMLVDCNRLEERETLQVDWTQIPLAILGSPASRHCNAEGAPDQWAVDLFHRYPNILWIG